MLFRSPTSQLRKLIYPDLPRSAEVEAACQRIVAEEVERAAAQGAKLPAIDQRLADAYTNKDTRAMFNILNETWFGVLTTDFERIRGFRELVELLDDPPEEVFP